MITRRKAMTLLASLPASSLLTRGQRTPASSGRPGAAPEVLTPRLASGAPFSPERTALISSFKQRSEGLEQKYEARTQKSDWVMPYRLFRPDVPGKLPLILYLHGSGGLGDDNLKQLGLGNIFGTRVWLLPENQKEFPCYVVAPQTDRGWVRYDPESMDKGIAKMLPGLGDGARIALEIVDSLCKQLPIDLHRIYVMGQSMGGGGTWNMMTYRPQFFAAAVICCGSKTLEDGTGSINTPLWNFHGDSDSTVPVAVSRDRMAARRKAGGTPLYSEYAGVDHNVWEWAFTEPELVKWLFAQQLRF